MTTEGYRREMDMLVMRMANAIANEAMRGLRLGKPFDTSGKEQWDVYDSLYADLESNDAVDEDPGAGLRAIEILDPSLAREADAFMGVGPWDGLTMPLSDIGGGAVFRLANGLVMDCHEWDDWFTEDELADLPEDEQPTGAIHFDIQMVDDLGVCCTIDGGVMGYREGDTLADLAGFSGRRIIGRRE